MRQSRLSVVRPRGARDQAAEIAVHLETAVPALRAACDIAEAKDEALEEALEEALRLAFMALRRYREQAASG